MDLITRKRKRQSVPEEDREWDEWVIGDRVIYLKEGHKLHSEYEAVEQYLPRGEVLRCTVDDLNPCLGGKIRVTLTPDKDATFAIMYDPNAGLPEFIVLERAYKEAMAIRYMPGQEFEANFDGVLYVGKIHHRMANIKSGWECLIVTWWNDKNEVFELNDDFKRVSPWEITLVDNSDDSSERGGGADSDGDDDDGDDGDDDDDDEDDNDRRGGNGKSRGGGRGGDKDGDYNGGRKGKKEADDQSGEPKPKKVKRNDKSSAPGGGPSSSGSGNGSGGGGRNSKEKTNTSSSGSKSSLISASSRNKLSVAAKQVGSSGSRSAPLSMRNNSSMSSGIGGSGPSDITEKIKERLAREAAEAAAAEEAKRKAAEEERLRFEAELQAAQLADELRKKQEREEFERKEEELRKKRAEEAALNAERMRLALEAARAKAAADKEAEENLRKSYRYTVAVVCASNMNRSMEAHAALAKKGIPVRSFGTGSSVKLPGMTKDDANVYEFGTTYAEIYDDLVRKDVRYYTRKGLLGMVERNKGVKEKPEKFQMCTEEFDVILCFESRVYDAAVEHLSSIGGRTMRSVHVINMEVKDHQQSAMEAAIVAVNLVMAIESCDDLDGEIDDVIESFQPQTKVPFLHTNMFY